MKEDEDAVRKAASASTPASSSSSSPSKGHEVVVTSHAVDICDLKRLREVLKEVEKEGRLECVHFNAARVEPSTVLEVGVEVVERDFMVCLVVLVLVLVLVPVLVVCCDVL